MDRQRSPMRQAGPANHDRPMKLNAVADTDTCGPCACGPGACAGLCTEHGMAAAHAAYHHRLLARARWIVVDPDLAEDVV